MAQEKIRYGLLTRNSHMWNKVSAHCVIPVGQLYEQGGGGSRGNMFQM